MLEDKFRHYSWYVDKTNGDLYHILLNVNNSNYSTFEKDNNNLLNDIRINKYKELRLNLNKLSRSKFLGSDYLYKFSINSNLGREHFQLTIFF